MRDPHVRFCERRGGVILRAYSTRRRNPVGRTRTVGSRLWRFHSERMGSMLEMLPQASRVLALSRATDAWRHGLGASNPAIGIKRVTRDRTRDKGHCGVPEHAVTRANRFGEGVRRGSWGAFKQTARKSHRTSGNPLSHKGFRQFPISRFWPSSKAGFLDVANADCIDPSTHLSQLLIPQDHT